MDPVSCLIVFRSLTQAQTAAAAFSRGGIGAALTRPPVSLSQGSCAYGLKIREEYLPAAVQILKKNGLAVIGVWRQTPEGRWREVVW